MTYNQKVWLGILLLCSFFWLAVIGGISSLNGDLGRVGQHRQSDELAAQHGQIHHDTRTAQGTPPLPPTA
ncbi:hypothetical protein [Serratia ficaria]|uniref:hypothetical protein n=1 Tax=Serratia ficaria TaxID=61651 RepID=UPI00077C4AB6|nr:hypothetical protein [Serratia ficaria]